MLRPGLASLLCAIGVAASATGCDLVFGISADGSTADAPLSVDAPVVDADPSRATFRFVRQRITVDPSGAPVYVEEPVPVIDWPVNEPPELHLAVFERAEAGLVRLPWVTGQATASVSRIDPTAPLLYRFRYGEGVFTELYLDAPAVTVGSLTWSRADGVAPSATQVTVTPSTLGEAIRVLTSGTRGYADATTAAPAFDWTTLTMLTGARARFDSSLGDRMYLADYGYDALGAWHLQRIGEVAGPLTIGNGTAVTVDATLEAVEPTTVSVEVNDQASYDVIKANAPGTLAREVVRQAFVTPMAARGTFAGHAVYSRPVPSIEVITGPTNMPIATPFVDEDPYIISIARARFEHLYDDSIAGTYGYTGSHVYALVEGAEVDALARLQVPFEVTVNGVELDQLSGTNAPTMAAGPTIEFNFNDQAAAGATEYLVSVFELESTGSATRRVTVGNAWSNRPTFQASTELWPRGVPLVLRLEVRHGFVGFADGDVMTYGPRFEQAFRDTGVFVLTDP